MPAQRSYNPCSYLPRRLQIAASLTLFLLITILFFGSSSDRATHYREGLSEGARRAAEILPENIHRQFSDSIFNPSRIPAHKVPPEQANSTSGDVSWLGHIKWKNPFSQSIAYDERAVLPPQESRTPIYTYYDYDPKKAKAEKEAEHDLILSWRRAWWAKGFKPVVLSRSDAVNHPMYKSMRDLNLEPSMETDMLRWLAWGSMGTGILANWLVFPMCDYNNDALKIWRKGEFEFLAKYKNLETGFYTGNKQEINAVLQAALGRKKSFTGKSIEDVVPKTIFHSGEDSDALAFYSFDTIKSKYKSIYDTIYSKDAAKGKMDLQTLIESHLHSTWQSLYPDGIAVLRPIPEAMTAVTIPAFELANNLTTCINTSLPSSCPPNIPRCKTCMTSQPQVVSREPFYRRSNSVFQIGTIPHPFTTQSLLHHSLLTSPKHLRRETERDSFILALTKEILGTGRASYERIVDVKSAIASPRGRASSMWFTAERTFDDALREDVSWQLGFPIASQGPDLGKSETPVPGPERRVKERKKPKYVPARMPDEKGVQKEGELIHKAKKWLKGTRGRGSKAKKDKKFMEAVEAWNMADREIWGFVRAWQARTRVEREVWEEEERKFAGSEAGGGWEKWLKGRSGMD